MTVPQSDKRIDGTLRLVLEVCFGFELFFPLSDLTPFGGFFLPLSFFGR